VCDINAGLLAALGIAAAYVHRLKTGEGQLVDTSLFEAGVQQTYWHSAIYFATGSGPGATGSAHILSAPYQAFRAADGWLTIGGANQPNWERLARVLGAPEWIADERFRTNGDRMKNLEALTELMNARLTTRSRAEWIRALEAEGVPCGPINSIADIFADPHYAARGAIVTTEDPALGTVRMQGITPKLSGTPGAVRRGAPLLGEHNAEIYGELLGLSETEVERLREGGVI
jgi:crotonobetainyl-CoA:carnitine CoA-transferase CaiB-like acyl-CoA transferase